MQRFGPINGLAGKRRLNVLFSRAKEKIVTFSSMTAADILADENGNAGVYMLKRWLEYVAGGALDSGAQTFREPDSDLEVFVMDQIRGMGFEPVPQVGVAGYFVDIGVRHPDWPHGFVLGVECDGASYHSAKSARDRDRLRQEVLEGLGWSFHRIWSTDWFNSPSREAARLRQVLTERMADLRNREAEFARTPSPVGQTSGTVSGDTRTAPSNSNLVKPPQKPAFTKGVNAAIQIGDTVRVRYLGDEQKVIRITISEAGSDFHNGIVHFETPLAKALLGAELGDEVEVLVGSYVKAAIVEHIEKSTT
jgi:very-short-patch-repair endonuclease